MSLLDKMLLGVSMTELIFMVEKSPEGGYAARALGESIFTEANNLGQLREMVRGAVKCHFDKGKAPKIVHLHFVHEEIIGI